MELRHALLVAWNMLRNRDALLVVSMIELDGSTGVALAAP